jgi:S1-C subfamily serine protease
MPGHRPQRPLRRRPLLRIVRTALLAGGLALALAVPVPARPAPLAVQGAPADPASLDELARSVLAVSAEIYPEARTAGVLGVHREGSGVVIDREGRVLTIGYLILEAETVHLRRDDGRVIPARVLGYDADSGLGLVQALAPLELEPIALGDSKALGVEAPVLMLSRSGAEDAHAAIVVSRRTFTGFWEYLLEDAIFTSPPQRDYAGAALLDQDLRLVGIGSLFVENAAEEAVTLPGNVFVPINRLKPVLKDLVANGRPPTHRPWLGVNVAEQFGRVIVMRVTPHGPAGDAGLEPGDIILELAGNKVDGVEHFYRQLWALGDAGIVVKLKLLQRSDIVRLSVSTRDRYAHYHMPARQ